MKNTVILLTTFAISLTPASFVQAQEAMGDSTWSIQAPVEMQQTQRQGTSVGLMGGYTLAINNLDKTIIPDVPSCCTGYDTETGGGFVFAGIADFIISDNFNIVTRLAYESSTVNLTANELTTVRVGSVPQQATITYLNTSNISVLSLEPGVEYTVGSLGFLAGLRVGALTRATYDEMEKLDQSIPYDYATVESGVRNKVSGSIKNTSTMQFGLFLGARYHLGLNNRRTLELIPELQFAPLFSNVLPDKTWSVSSVRVMLGISYSLFSKAEASPLAPER